MEYFEVDAVPVVPALSEESQIELPDGDARLVVDRTVGRVDRSLQQSLVMSALCYEKDCRDRDLQ